MDNTLLLTIRDNLRRRRDDLREWLRSTANWKKQIHFGPAGEVAAQQHLQVLDTALAKAENHTLGRCEICHDYIETELLQMDFTACVCLDHLSAEKKQRLEMDLELANKVHKSLLPQKLPTIPGLRLAVYSKSAEIVGGDYFDFFRFRDGAYGLAIADVMGKGLPASMLMASMQAALRILVPENDTPEAIANRLNALFCHNTQLIRFITLFLARFEPESGVLTFCNAGHNPPLLWRGSSKDDKQAVQWLEPTAAAIGLAENFVFKSARVELAAGDILLMYTDGVTEARNAQGEEYGEERLTALIKQNATAPVQELIKALQHSLHEFTGGRGVSDDTTIVVGKRG